MIWDHDRSSYVVQWSLAQNSCQSKGAHGVLEQFPSQDAEVVAAVEGRDVGVSWLALYRSVDFGCTVLVVQQPFLPTDENETTAGSAKYSALEQPLLGLHSVDAGAETSVESPPDR